MGEVSVFGWEELATDDVCTQIAALARAPDAPTEQLRKLLGQVFAHTGGLPAVTGRPSTAELADRAFRLFHDALRHTLAELGFGVERRGFTRQGDEVVAIDRVDVNTADETQLERLPVIGPKTAASIVSERRSGGWFQSSSDLADRVAGIGTDNLRDLASRLSYTAPTGEAQLLSYDHLGLDDCLARLLERIRVTDPVDRLLRGLEAVAMTCARLPHPASREQRIREPVSIQVTVHPTDRVQLLSGSAYYPAVQTEIVGATASIDVAMFHIAMPAENHPTRAILDALIAAATRQVSVRVVVDRDRASDPYNSEIINAAALAYLRSHGVTCRSDESRRLLHSKFVVLDGQRGIIGSHNWSAGSYFRFDDTSVLIASASLATEMSQRFDAMWAAATE